MQKSWIILAGFAVFLAGSSGVVWWALRKPATPPMRVPIVHIPKNAPIGDLPQPAPFAVTLTPGEGTPGDDLGDWPQFRGPDGTGVLTDAAGLARGFSGDGPTMLWSVDLGEGYAGPIVRDGRVYLIDYDMAANADALRCLSLDTGKEIWRASYPVKVKRSHGMSRTVPALWKDYLVSIGPKCHVLCVDPKTGEERWFIDMVTKYGTRVPPWYAGQCPLFDNGKLIIAPAGAEVLMAALDPATGEEVWRTPNTPKWQMTHCSIAVVEVGGKRMYVYSGSGGVAGIDADDGTLLWQTDAWKVKIAAVATPVVLPGGRLFCSGGYGAGCAMLQVKALPDGGLGIEVLWRLGPRDFGATQQTPIYHQGHIFGVRPDGQFACLSPEGKVVYASGPRARFGIGPYLIAGDLVYLVNDDGDLTLAELSTERWKSLGTWQVLDGHEAWGPLAIAGSKLLVRDLTQMRCLDVGE